VLLEKRKERRPLRRKIADERIILNIILSLHKLFSDKVIHKANFRFCHLKVLMKYKYIDKFNKNIRIQKLPFDSDHWMGRSF
jgi:hypothetical protein